MVHVIVDGDKPIELEMDCDGCHRKGSPLEIRGVPAELIRRAVDFLEGEAACLAWSVSQGWSAGQARAYCPTCSLSPAKRQTHPIV